MEEIIKIIEELRNTSSTKEKENILKRNKDNELLQKVLYYTYNPYMKYGISEKSIKSDASKPLAYFDIFELLNVLEKNNINDNLRFEVNNFLGNFSHEIGLFDLYKCMILKDLRCNISAKTINKVFKELVPTFDVMLASKYFDNEDRVNNDFIVTTKLDGIRCVGFRENGVVRFYSRQGQLIEGLVEIEQTFDNIPENVVLDGELLLKNDKGLPSDELYRETVKVVRKDGIKKNVEFHVFDMLSLNSFKEGICKMPCIERKQALRNMISDIDANVLVEVPILYVGNDKSKVLKLLDEAIKNDSEGVMVNIANAPYECKRSKNILKVKKFNDADVRVLQVLEGTGKNVNKLGAITIQFEYNGTLHECNCGSGFSDEERIRYWEKPSLILNKIVTIGYFEISENKQGGAGLRFPTWKGIIREDKNKISMY